MNKKITLINDLNELHYIACVNSNVWTVLDRAVHGKGKTLRNFGMQTLKAVNVSSVNERASGDRESIHSASTQTQASRVSSFSPSAIQLRTVPSYMITLIMLSVQGKPGPAGLPGKPVSIWMFAFNNA